MKITPINVAISFGFIIWIYSSYYVTLAQIERHGELNIKGLVFGILIPPSLIIIGCVGLLMLYLYAETGSNAINKIFNGGELDLFEMAWIIENV